MFRLSLTVEAGERGPTHAACISKNQTTPGTRTRAERQLEMSTEKAHLRLVDDASQCGLLRLFGRSADCSVADPVSDRLSNTQAPMTANSTMRSVTLLP